MSLGFTLVPDIRCPWASVLVQDIIGCPWASVLVQDILGCPWASTLVPDIFLKIAFSSIYNL